MAIESLNKRMTSKQLRRETDGGGETDGGEDMMNLEFLLKRRRCILLTNKNSKDTYERSGG